MILFNNVDEIRKTSMLILYSGRDYLRLESEVERRLRDRIENYIDPKGIVFQKDSENILDVSSIDYDYIKKIVENILNIASEIDIIRVEDPITQTPSISQIVEHYLENFISSKLVPYLGIRYIKDVSAMRRAIPSQLSEKIETYVVSLISPSEIVFNHSSWPKIDRSFVSRFIDDQEGINSVIYNFTESPINDATIGRTCGRRVITSEAGDSFSVPTDNEYIFAGWFDDISKLYKDSGCVIEYEYKLRNLPLRRIDLEYLLSYCEYRGLSFPPFSELDVQKLLDIFWAEVDKIKKILVRGKIRSTPPHIVNIFWSMFVK